MSKVTVESYSRRLLRACLLVLAVSSAAAQGLVSVEDGKVSLLQAILYHTTWPEEQQIDRFVIGLYGRDPALLKALRSKAPELSVRGKPVVVTQFSSLEKARAAHVLVLSRSQNADLRKIDRALLESHTLVVTDSSEDQSHIMVNFVHPSETRLTFEVNSSNIVYAGLQLSKDILLFGGTELDAATIYRETEAELVRAKALATQQMEQLELQQRLLAEQKSTIESQRREVAANTAKLVELERQLTGTRSTLALNENRLRESEQRLLENAAALSEKENILAEKEAYIESYSSKIDRNRQRLEDQQAAIENQERQIAEQNSVLARQLTTIENQQVILSAAVAALILVLTLIAIIFRGYRSKHRMARKLEGKTRELEVANEQLVQLTEAKSRFLSTMSHEIRTPMNGVIGMAELLEGTELSSQQREYVSLIIKSADTLLGLINDILDFSKIEAGGLELETVPFRLRDILGDTLQSMSLRAAESGLELTYHIPPEVPDRLLGDPLRLRQVVINLVGNAIKFTPSGEVVVDLRLESKSDSAARVVFEVRDTGVGISESEQQKIFEAFGQADSSTTRQFGGTGLGLAIAAQLAEMMGGSLTVSSKVGQGSRFSFAVDFQLPRGGEVEPLHPASLRNQRALVVDDNSTNRMILQELLLNWGMRVSVVDSGEAALAELERTGGDGPEFVLALLDVMMPRMDGFELAGKIRQQSRLAGLRILMLTSAGRSDQEALRAELDISRILLKPVKHSDLLQAMTDALGVSEAEAGKRIPEERPEGVAARRVLLVEDNPVNQKVARDLLTRRGHLVELAQNGQEAVAAVGQAAFDVVLMDIHMPVMDGLAATRAIRARECSGGTHVPIIAMTAGATTEDREQCFAAGMDAFVSKPFRAADLNRAVESIAAGAERGNLAVAAPASPGEVACLDWQGALEKLDGDEVLLLELADMFLDQCPSLVADIEAAIAAEEAEVLQRAAHTLKGSAQVIGGRAVATAALVLENMGREQDTGAAAAALADLKQEAAALSAALASMRGQAAAAGGDRGGEG